MRNTLTLLAAFALLGSACKKNDSQPAPATKLKYLTQILRINGKDTTITNYNYDAQKKLTQIIVLSGARTETTTFTYSGDNVTYSETTTKNAGVNGSKLINDFTYIDNLVATKKTRFFDGAGKLTGDRANGYAYNDKNQLIEAHQDGNVTFYEYGSDGNIIKKKFSGVEVNLTYDGKTNGAANVNSAVRKAAIALGFEHFSYNGNLVSTARTGLPPSQTTYEYSIDNFPISAKSGNEVSTFKYITE